MNTMPTAHAANVADTDPEYYQFEKLVAERVTVAHAQPLFETDVDPEKLWAAYLDNLPADRRQHYNCNCCRRFIQRYGGLVHVDLSGATESAIWGRMFVVPSFFTAAVEAMTALVTNARVTGVFVCDDARWGSEKTGEWTHLGGVPGLVVKHRLRTVNEMAGEHRTNFATLSQGLVDYPADVVAQAVRVLQADALDRSEKTLGVARWFELLHADLSGLKSKRQREHRVWRAVATAPPGYCNVRSSMISTLLDDIKAALPFETIAARWAKKMHPLQYQRPQAPPAAGAIAAAEKAFETAGLARSLLRRYATLDDVLLKLWTPKPPAETPAAGGIFGHLKPPAKAVAEVALPAAKTTWNKFRQAVLPTAQAIEIRVPIRGKFYGLATAADPDAPPVLQWDGLAGRPRNPVSAYAQSPVGYAERWGLSVGWHPVTAVFPSPAHWQEPGRFTHQLELVMFAIAGCRDLSNNSLCLFPETLKAELHAFRSVIEAHSRSQKLTGEEAASANGLYFANGSGPGDAITLRVRGPGGTQQFEIDRWE